MLGFGFGRELIGLGFCNNKGFWVGLRLDQILCSNSLRILVMKMTMTNVVDTWESHQALPLKGS